MRAPSRLRPLLLPVPIAAGGFAVGGVLGVLLGFLAVLLWLDRLLDRLGGVTAGTQIDAERAFRRMGRGAPGPALVHLPLDRGWAAVATRLPRGVQPIPVASIVGSVDAHKAATFDRAFRPPRFSRGRWTLMYRAAERGTQLPPISVYRVGQEHYVEDGHHRVSVARARGTADIEARVVELGAQRRSA